MAEELVSPVETRGVSAEEPFHARNEISLGSFDDQMKMITHQTIGMNLPAGFHAGFTQRSKKALPIDIVMENRLTPVPAIDHVINCPGILHSQLSRHARTLSKRSYAAIVGTDPFIALAMLVRRLSLSYDLVVVMRVDPLFLKSICPTRGELAT